MAEIVNLNRARKAKARAEKDRRAEANRIAHEKQQHAGWTPVLSYDAGVARLTVPDGAGHPVDLGTVTLLVNRPVGGHDDQTVTMKRTAAGDYEAPVTIGTGRLRKSRARSARVMTMAPPPSDTSEQSS